MEMDFAALASLTAVMTFVFSAFNYIVIRPLSKAIDSLKEAVDELRHEQKERLTLIHAYDLRLSILEQLTTRIQQDIDDVKKTLAHGQ